MFPTFAGLVYLPHIRPIFFKSGATWRAALSVEGLTRILVSSAMKAA